MGRSLAPRPTPIDGDKSLTGEERDAIAESLVGAWPEGNRHAVALGVAGMLAKAGVREEEAKAIVEHAAVLAGDDEPGDRATAVRTSYERVRSGLPARGFMGLRGLIPTETLAFLDAMLQPLRDASVPSLKVPAVHALPHDTNWDAPLTPEGEALLLASYIDPVSPDYAPPPEVCFRGWFAEYRALMAPTTEAPDAFHLGASLALVGAMLGRRVWTANGDVLYPSLYVLIVGPTGSARKDTAMGRAFKTMPKAAPRFYPDMRPRGPEFAMLYDLTSSESLVEWLSNEPSTVLYQSELSMMVRRGRRETTSTILPQMIRLWDCPDRLDLLSRTKGQAATAERPFVTMIAATTPDTLAADMSDADIASGFGNRLLIFGGNGKEANPNPPAVDMVRAGDLMDLLRDTVEAAYPERDPDGYEFTKTPAAEERFAAWYRDFHVWPHANDQERGMAQRLGANAHKLAVIYAASAGHARIEDGDLEAALALVGWHWDYARTEARRWGQDQEARVEATIAKRLRRGPAHRTVLRDLVGEAIPVRIVNTVIKQMHEGMQIDLDPVGNVAKRPGVTA
ncbi:MAG: DUF3987 domain-containing protein [Gemmatimonadales bacterium]|nr:DUF3987 domain-containing protein [Gemmatimonadales bacterium]